MSVKRGLLVLLALSVATSIDALAIGITLSILTAGVVAAAAIIGVVTFTLSYAGILIGKRFGHFFESKIEILGGVILIASIAQHDTDTTQVAAASQDIATVLASVRVREITGRLAGMVPLPSRLHVRCLGREGHLIAFDAVGDGGAPVLRDGVLRGAS